MLNCEKQLEIEEGDQALHRRLRELREIVVSLKKSKMTPLKICESILENRFIDLKIRTFFKNLPAEEKHYWIASLYALLMPEQKRMKLAAYFTPPHLVQYVVSTLIELGIDIGQHRILDPASGGAAFLVPLARHIKDNSSKSSKNIISSIESTLAGVEIEPNLASLSELLLKDLLRTEISNTGHELKTLIKRANTLKLEKPDKLYDVVVGNPPYGRVLRPTPQILKDFSPIISDGYVNLYALFVEQAIKWVRPKGFICLIIPTSFIGGPYFSALRERILETCRVINLDLIDKRSDVFLDVVQDVCVLVLQKKQAKGNMEFKVPTCSLITMGKPRKLLGNLGLPTAVSNRVWVLPDEEGGTELFQEGLETLEDYGYIIKSGYFVWNREKERYRIGRKPGPKEVPLFWAHNVKANCICSPLESTSKLNSFGFVKFNEKSSAIIKSDAIILQRTSNRRQDRRLIASIIRKNKVPGKKGFVSENHTILIVPDPKKTQLVSLKILCRLINTSQVDGRFRRISGSVSVSTKALRGLPLPVAKEVVLAFKADKDDNNAAKIAYAKSIVKTLKKPKGKKRGGK
ncbi:MAG: N-6 DNA methylase [Alphaproteobacteria bacterium]